MMDMYQWASLFLSTAIGTVQILFTARVLTRRPNLRAVCLFAACYAVLMLVLLPGAFQTVLIGLNILLLFAVGRILGAPCLPSLAAAILAVCIAQFANGVGASLLALLLELVAGTPFYAAVFWAITAGSAVLYAAAAWATARCLPDAADGSSRTVLVLVPFLFFLGTEVFVSSTVYDAAHFPTDTQERLSHVLLLLLQATGIVAILCTAAVSRYISVALRQRADIEALEQASDLQSTYVREAQRRYERTRSARHDLKNHVTVLCGLLDAGKSAEAREYLASLQTVVKTVSLPAYTGNGAVDILLAEKIAAAQEAGLTVAVEAPLPRSTHIPDADLCVIFGNALDNAAAAASRTGHGHIVVSAARQGDFLLLTVRNSMMPGSEIVPGIGMRNMRTAAEKHGGAMEYCAQDGMFVLRVLLNSAAAAEDSSVDK